ncbi:MAG: antibiotic biosynthesis monooxygenase [Victivallaceae bacterium]|nr:antibiotic biosynthesis monooxygenase [Victivallaceae bacterium]
MDDVIITNFCPVVAKPGRRDELLARLLECARQTRLEQGNICYRVHVSVKNPDLIMIYEQWRDAAALGAHTQMPYLQAFLADRDGLLAHDIVGTECRER